MWHLFYHDPLRNSSLLLTPANLLVRREKEPPVDPDKLLQLGFYEGYEWMDALSGTHIPVKEQRSKRPQCWRRLIDFLSILQVLALRGHVQKKLDLIRVYLGPGVESVFVYKGDVPHQAVRYTLFPVPASVLHVSSGLALVGFHPNA